MVFSAVGTSTGMRVARNSSSVMTVIAPHLAIDGAIAGRGDSSLANWHGHGWHLELHKMGSDQRLQHIRNRGVAFVGLTDWPAGRGSRSQRPPFPLHPPRGPARGHTAQNGQPAGS